MAIWALPVAPKEPHLLKITAKWDPHPAGIVTAYLEDSQSQVAEIDTNGNISSYISPKFAGVRIRIPAPGYNPPEIVQTLTLDNAKHDALEFGPLPQPTEKVVGQPTPNPANYDK